VAGTSDVSSNSGETTTPDDSSSGHITRLGADLLRSTSLTSYPGFGLGQPKMELREVRPEPSPLESIFKEIEAALDAGLYYLALASTLTIPDLCAGLECEVGKVWVTDKKYMDWFERHVAKNFKWFSAYDCYKLRCGVVHNGKLGHPGSRYDRLVFILPGNHGVEIGESLMKNVAGLKETCLSLGLVPFCRQLMAAARDWYDANKGNPNVRGNMPHLVRHRPHGSPPYIVGFPVIA
jgi:hypothetical protein